MKQDKQSFCVTISSWEKDGAQPIISYMVYLIIFEISLTNIVTYHEVTIEKSEKKSFFIQFHVFPSN